MNQMIQYTIQKYERNGQVITPSREGVKGTVISGEMFLWQLGLLVTGTIAIVQGWISFTPELFAGLLGGGTLVSFLIFEVIFKRPAIHPKQMETTVKSLSFGEKSSGS